MLRSLVGSEMCIRDRLWAGLDGDGLVKLYDDTVSALLDRQVPLRTVTFRRRPSNPWYDDDCRTAKRSVRTAERSARRAGLLSDVTLPAVLAWRTERRHYLDLVRRKREAFWATRVDVEQHQPCRLWRSFAQLLGRGRTPLADIDATVLHRPILKKADMDSADVKSYRPISNLSVVSKLL